MPTLNRKLFRKAAKRVELGLVMHACVAISLESIAVGGPYESPESRLFHDWFKPLPGDAGQSCANDGSFWPTNKNHVGVRVLALCFAYEVAGRP